MAKDDAMEDFIKNFKEVAPLALGLRDQVLKAGRHFID